jgi:hypothetical protein
MTNSKNVDAIIPQMKQIIVSIESTAILQLNQPVNINVLRQTEKNLKNIEFRLQFELLIAEDEAEISGDFTLVDTLSDAIEKSQDALNAVRATLVKTLVIGGGHDQIISELKDIRGEIDHAIEVQKTFNSLIHLAGLVRRFVGA